MTQKYYYVSHLGEQLGPWPVEDILAKIRTGHVEINDYCYDEQKEDWVLLVEHPSFSDKVKEIASQQIKVKEILVDDLDASAGDLDPNGPPEWYVLKGENKFGPFAYRDVVRMLQEKSIYEFDYVWNAAMTTWKRVAELKEFAPDEIRILKDSGEAEISDVFFRRRHARVDFFSSIIIHDNKHVWKGKSMEVSAGGAGLVIENALLQPGQTLYLHFKPAEALPPFNAVCEVVSKQYIKGVKDKNAPIRYGVKFTSINTNAQKKIFEYTSKKTALKAA